MGRVRGAHLSKITKGGAAQVLVMQRWASPPYYVPIDAGWHIKNKGRIAVSILFDDRTPLYLMDAPDMLSTFTIIVLNIVQLMENL